MIKSKWFSTGILVLSLIFNLYSADQVTEEAPRVFIDGQGLDMNYIRTETNFVNYVNEPREADVHVLITTQNTGSGGREYTMAFIGQNGHKDLQNTLKYFSSSTDTQDEIREGYSQILKLGLTPYIANTAMASAVSVNFQQVEQQEQRPASIVTDKWDNWIFNIRLNSRLNGESSRKNTNLSGSLSIDRVTDASKFNVDLIASYQENKYQFGNETRVSKSESQTMSSLLVLSISDHWSVGGSARAYSSTTRNYDISLDAGPAVEYNFFPYSESTRRELRLLYKIGYEYNRYREMTIFGKTSEGLLNESLELTLELNEPWGDAGISLEGAHYFPSFDKKRLTVDGELSIRLFRGFSLNINGRYSKIADQINLVAGDATLEEILLNRRELASDYTYSISVGIGFRFGSIFNNIVNSRFGSGGGGQGGGNMYR